ncbi:helix-turn-helix domain-containing protein [Enterococcus hirae]|uniref:helix-turn-helix domain-containing protein n=1 Tax=Enterococcus hirae TaxID=1354 RepID=UPI0009B12013|nr:helix-turn-helix domain-containing protein [Enterococcus hirae]EMF0065635.1 helix-turn-helix domain-containing protein [Enterococcus hirae]EMF0097273.1 helix-turn-helix domain-containing protein [Enterococcus hirae]EMF0139116.1 helix-turn-helix domain-containing protein [Enterococcus hirae]EMF0198243.1 helix-turn-helix domain-containing protein [Enterococcus hirae]MBA5261789.1 helix-turn-helix domain-containing protein [Enterococcus hirae]
MERVSPANRLKQLMSERNLKQVDILNMSIPYQKSLGIKMSKSHLSQYVNGKSNPDQNKLYLLGKTLNVNEAWLMGFDVPKDRVPDEKRNDENDTQEINITPIFNQLNKENQQDVYNYAEQKLASQDSKITHIPKKDKEEVIDLAAHSEIDGRVYSKEEIKGIMNYLDQFIDK